MKPKVLLAGGTGYIGKYLSEVIENDAELFAISKYPDNKKQMMLKLLGFSVIYFITNRLLPQ